MIAASAALVTPKGEALAMQLTGLQRRGYPRLCRNSEAMRMMAHGGFLLL